VIVELINTGSELMLGRVLNTHQQWLCRRLTDLGYTVPRQVAVPDTGNGIQQTVREALARADLVITTGGLGPTSDDLTRELIAQLLGRDLREDATVLAHIRHLFKSRRRPMPERTRVQALIPEGAQVLPNPHGTAPGLAIDVRPNPFRAGGQSTWLIMLPGPPRELRPMFTETVVPLLQRVLPPPGRFACRTLRTTGIGESMAQEKIGGPLQALVNAGLDLGYCSRPGQVDVRLAARGAAAEQQVRDAEAVVRRLLGPYIYGVEEEELETVIVRLLTERKETLALAESCTGGHIANRITDVPGASAILLAGLVTYSNAAKEKSLGVSAETLARHGAVSEPVAREMAEGARRQTGADYALSVTGIAGPSGGTPEKPVGTVFIGLAGPSGTLVERHFNPLDRETFKQVTTNQALDLLRRTLTAARSGGAA
jgi:nicotinamide-nucleotide amidase